MRGLRQVDGDNPFEAVAGGRCEEKLGLEVVVIQETATDEVDVVEMIEIETQEAGMLFERLLGARRESA